MLYFDYVSGKFEKLLARKTIFYHLPFYITDNNVKRNEHAPNNKIIYKYYGIPKDSILKNDIRIFEELKNDIRNETLETMLKKLMDSNLADKSFPVLDEAINNYGAREIDHYEQMQLFKKYDIYLIDKLFYDSYSIYRQFIESHNINRWNIIMACKILLDISNEDYRYFSSEYSDKDDDGNFCFSDINQLLILFSLLKKDYNLIEKVLKNIIINPYDLYIMGKKMDKEHIDFILEFQFENISKNRNEFAKVMLGLCGIYPIQLMIDARINFDPSDDIFPVMNNIKDDEIYDVYDFLIDNDIGTDNLFEFAIKRGGFYNEVKYLLDMECKLPVDEELDIVLGKLTYREDTNDTDLPDLEDMGYVDLRIISLAPLYFRYCIIVPEIKLLTALIQNYEPSLNTSKLYYTVRNVIPYCSYKDFVNIMKEFKINIEDKIYDVAFYNLNIEDIHFNKYNNNPSEASNYRSVGTAYCLDSIKLHRLDIFEYLLDLSNNKCEIINAVLSYSSLPTEMYREFFETITKVTTIEEIWEPIKKFAITKINSNNIDIFRILSNYLEDDKLEEILLECKNGYYSYINIYGQVLPEILTKYCDKIISDIINSYPIDFRGINKMVEVSDPTNWINDNIIKVCLDNYKKCQKILEWCSINCKEKLIDMIFCMDIFKNKIYEESYARKEFDNWFFIMIPSIHEMLPKCITYYSSFDSENYTNDSENYTNDSENDEDNTDDSENDEYDIDYNEKIM